MSVDENEVLTNKKQYVTKLENDKYINISEKEVIDTLKMLETFKRKLLSILKA